VTPERRAPGRVSVYHLAEIIAQHTHPEDLIVSVGGVAIEGVDDLLRDMTGELIGERVQLDLIREGRQLAVEVVPVELVT